MKLVKPLTPTEQREAAERIRQIIERAQAAERRARMGLVKP